MLLLFACASTDTADSKPPVDTAYDWPDAPVPTEVIGWVEVVEQPASAYARLAVEFWAGKLPSTQEVVTTDGDCTLLVGPTMNQWDCDPVCDYGTQACIAGECVDYPALAPAGTVTVTGLAPGDAVLDPSGGRYGIPSGYDGELFGAGDVIRVTSTGGDTPALDLDARGVETLQAATESYSFTPGDPFAVTWTTPTTGAPSRIRLLLETGWHGSPSLTTIWCETDDDGELTVPASLTTEFPIPSCGECEMSELQRFTRDVVDFGQGPIELLVASELSFVPWW